MLRWFGPLHSKDTTCITLVRNIFPTSLYLQRYGHFQNAKSLNVKVITECECRVPQMWKCQVWSSLTGSDPLLGVAGVFIFKTEIFVLRIRLPSTENGGFQIRMTSCQGSKLACPHIRSKTLRVDVDFFKYKEKNLRFRKYPATCGRSKMIQKRYVLRQIFLKTEKKIFFIKNSTILKQWQKRCAHMVSTTIAKVLVYLFMMTDTN